MSKVNRPKSDKEAGELPLATDVLVASLWRRLVAFIIDMAIVSALIIYVTTPILTNLFGTMDDQTIIDKYVRLLALESLLTWGIYVVCFNVSRLRATVGQRAMRIYVCDIFGNTIKLPVAMGRFLIFAAPMLVLIAGGIEDIVTVLPAMFGVAIPHAHMVEPNENFTILFLVVGLVQFLLIWPLLTGNYSRVLWDDLFNTRVLMDKMRSD